MITFAPSCASSRPIDKAPYITDLRTMQLSGYLQAVAAFQRLIIIIIII